MSQNSNYQYIEYGVWVMDFFDDMNANLDDAPIIHCFDEWTFENAYLCLLNGRTYEEEVKHLGWIVNEEHPMEKHISLLSKEVENFYKNPAFFTYLDEDSPHRDRVRLLIHSPSCEIVFGR